MKKIAITGTHGAGKTTLAHQICVMLKEKNVNVTVVEEKARSCPFPINKQATADTEIWMVHTQIKAEQQAKASKYECAVIDRCSLDAIIYWQDRNTPHKYFEKLRDAALEWVQTEYDLVILLEPSSDTEEMAVDAVRDSSIAYRNQIRDLFRQYLETMPQSFYDRLIKIESNEVFARGAFYSEAVEKIMEHPSCPFVSNIAGKCLV